MVGLGLDLRTSGYFHALLTWQSNIVCKSGSLKGDHWLLTPSFRPCLTFLPCGSLSYMTIGTEVTVFGNVNFGVKKKKTDRTSLMVQWLRIYLPMQGTQV